MKKKIILGIETSCDDTSIAVVDSDQNILSNIVVNQNNYHQQFGGIVPEIAARAHLHLIDTTLKKIITESRC